MAPEGLGADEARTAKAVRASRAGVALAVIMVSSLQDTSSQSSRRAMLCLLQRE